jgi:type I restriction enzyme M protein
VAVKFKTPESVSRLMVGLISPTGGSIYDGCCGTGKLLIDASNYISKNSADSTDVLYFAQEKNIDAWEIVKSNFQLHGLKVDIGNNPEDTLLNNIHTNLQADFIVSNIPFNQKNWGREILENDPRWVYGLPPKSDGNFAWIQHYLHHLSDSGSASLLLPLGSLFTLKTRHIREKIILANKLECIIELPEKMIEGTGIKTCIWVLSNNSKRKSLDGSEKRILMIDCSEMGHKVTKTQKKFSEEELLKIIHTYQVWKSDERDISYLNQDGFCRDLTIEEISENDFDLNVRRYVGLSEETSSRLKLPTVKIPIPSLEEQLRIVNEIEELNADLKEISDKLKDYFQYENEEE